MALSVILLAMFAGVILLAYGKDLRRAATPATGATHRSPLAEAERILAERYARGELTREEYERMLTILRR